MDTIEITNELAVIINNSGLEKTKGQVLLEKFNNYFEIAGEWEAKLKELNITDVSQKSEMKQADEARKFLKAKRIEVENTRKSLKEESLREGQTIDSIAKILKNLIEPLEEIAEQKARFAEIQEQKEKDRLRMERIELLLPYNVAYDSNMLMLMSPEMWDSYFHGVKIDHNAKIEAEIKAQEQRREVERLEKLRQEEIKAENERLKAETLKLRIEEEKRRSEHEAEIKRIHQERQKEIEIQNEVAKKLRDEQELILKEQREKVEKAEKELQAKRDAELKAENERLANIEADLSKGDKEKFDSLINEIEALTSKYFFKSKKFKTLYLSVAELLNKTINYSISKV